MSRILYVGDIHARINDLGRIVMSADSKKDAAIVQVGDFGFGFPDRAITLWLEKRAEKSGFKTPIYTCMGNHDNWDLLYDMWEERGRPDMFELVPNSNCFYVHRTSLIDIFGVSHLFLGGAESTDQHHRKSGISWWDREEASDQEFEKFFEVFDTQKPDTIITHDAPLRVELFRVRRNQSRTPNILERVYQLSKHRPRRHYFGHHHMLDKWKIDGTKFYCCGLHGEFHERGLSE